MLEIKKASEKEFRLKQQLARVDADLKRAQKRLKDAVRRADTRRKILLGGAFLAATERGTIPADTGKLLVRDFIADRDKALFDGGPFALRENSESGATTAAADTQE